jgi:hypothetical protein
MFQALHKRVMQSLADIFRKRRRLGIAINLNRLSRGVHHDAAVLAFRKMLFQLDANPGAQIAIQIFRQLGN